MKTKVLAYGALVAVLGSLLTGASAFAANHQSGDVPHQLAANGKQQSLPITTALQGHWTPIAWGVCWMPPGFNGNSCQFHYQGKLWQVDRVTLYNRIPGALCGSYSAWGIQGPAVPRTSPTPCWGCVGQIYMERRLIMNCR